MMNKIKDVYSWAWTVDWGRGPELCFWSEPTKKDLLKNGKPSPEAKAVRVRMSVSRNKS